MRHHTGSCGPLHAAEPEVIDSSHGGGLVRVLSKQNSSTEKFRPILAAGRLRHCHRLGLSDIEASFIARKKSGHMDRPSFCPLISGFHVRGTLPRIMVIMVAVHLLSVFSLSSGGALTQKRRTKFSSGAPFTDVRRHRWFPVFFFRAALSIAASGVQGRPFCVRSLAELLSASQASLPAPRSSHSEDFPPSSLNVAITRRAPSCQS